MLFGTFDILHPGHEYLFTEAKKKADTLIVCLGLAKTVEAIKGKAPLHSETERKRRLAQHPLISKVIMGSSDNPMEAVLRYRPDIVGLGYDQHVFVDRLMDCIRREGLHTRVIRFKPFHPEIYKSSYLKHYA